MRLLLHRYGVVLGPLAAFAAFLLVIVLAGCGSIVYQPAGQASSSHPLGTAQPSIPGFPAPSPTLHRVHDPGQVTGTVAGPCHSRQAGQLPDRGCTPGAYDPAITAAVLCSPSYSTSTYRPPSSQTSALKYNVVEPAYGQNHVSGELDHLISLELGGSNDASNLWVEAGPIPNPKDKVENALHKWVCAGPGAETRLRRAQAAIAVNWTTALQRVGA